jgi:4-amino-4-deoxy-L-arabinose transferase-like glycosyltransferase
MLSFPATDLHGSWCSRTTMKKLASPIAALILIFLLWIMPGLIGRDPWKADEPYTVGIVSHIIQTGDWIVPHVAGEPFLEKPPLFFLVAAGFGRMLSPPLSLHDASRLASAVFILLTVLFLALAARELFGAESGVTAALLLIGCVHLQATAHKLITDIGLIAGLSMALYGFARSGLRPVAGGFWIGTGTGIGFLSKGLLAPGIVGVVAVALPALFPLWRRKNYVHALAIGIAASLPWLLIWPLALYQRSPSLFLHLFWHENFGRFLGFNEGSVGFNATKPDSHSYYVLNIVWLGWPVAILALWTLWHFRRSWREHPVYQVPLVVFLVTLAVLSAAATNRALYALPLLLPLTLIAVPGFDLLPAGVKNMANKAGVILFGLLGLLLWLGWAILMTGHPAALAQKLHAFQPDYRPSVEPVLVIGAVFYSLAWLVTVFRFTRAPNDAAVNWTLGVVLTWGLIMTLWLPALNAGSSFRAAFLSLKGSLPEASICIASRGLGDSERAMLEYFAGLRTRRLEVFPLENCDLLLEQRAGGAPPSANATMWRPIWEYRHPSLRPKDIFTLYRRIGGA